MPRAVLFTPNDSTLLINPILLFLESNIENLLAFFRATWPSESITPKLHLLEDHTVEFIGKWGSALGVYGEQGAESLHSSFSTMKEAYRSMHPAKKRLEATLKEHYARVNPESAKLRPVGRKRKTEE